MRIVEPIGHAEEVRALWRAARAGRLPHALGFMGPEGIGKCTAALWFVQGLLCEDGPAMASGSSVDRPCGVCSSCRKLNSGGWYGNHTDFLRMDPVEYVPPQRREAEGAQEGESNDKRKSTILHPRIRLLAIAERSDEDFDERMNLARFLDRKAEGASGRRVVLIRESERLREDSMNALLKTLEEPAANVFLILECSRPEDLLITVRSRMTELWLRPLDQGQVRAAIELPGPLAEALANSDQPLDLWSELAQGAPGRILRAVRQGHPAISAVWSELLNGKCQALQAVEDIYAIPGEYQGATPKQQERTRVAVALELLSVQLVAHWRASLDNPESGRELALRRRLDFVGQTLADLSLNIDPRACLERCALHAAASDATSVGYPA